MIERVGKENDNASVKILEYLRVRDLAGKQEKKLMKSMYNALTRISDLAFFDFTIFNVSEHRWYESFSHYKPGWNCADP